MEIAGENSIITNWIGLCVHTYPGVDRSSHLRKAMEGVLKMTGDGAKDGTPGKPILVITSPCCKRTTTYQYISDIPLITTPCPCGAEGRLIVKWSEQWDQQNIPIDSPSRTDHQIAEALGRTKINRWEEGIPHHPQSKRLMTFLADHDFKDCGDSFCWKVGGDGDNGESLMYEIDAFFETMDLLSGKTEHVPCLGKWPDSIGPKVDHQRIWILEYRENPGDVVVIAPATSLDAIKAMIKQSKGDFDKGYFVVYSQIANDYGDLNTPPDFYDLDGNLLDEQPV